ncbi:WecB/TagA/CpsF family glycosyltransferase [Phycisphaerales bacterium AB-hyl4]|uniref:WecB/TagA/CpsF family glycosyltransferase n=1 Tax=Natronomicrosphaera hydrolytica TaxID=3242702 RepID=A0ABV4U8H9_9BACT
MRADPALKAQARALSFEIASPLDPPREVQLHGFRLHALTESQCIRHILAALAVNRGGWVITPNLDHLRRARRDPVYRAMLAEADIVVADGMPLVWASRLQGTPLPERVAGSSLIQTLSEAAALRDHRLFLLGGAPGAAARAATVLAERFPGSPVVRYDEAPYGFDRDPAAIDQLAARLRESQPAIVFVALGSPKQEQIIRQLRPVLPNAWWLGVGISFSFVAGQVRRAPRWMQQAGLEWMHRLAQEPTRLGRRYLLDGPPFAMSLLCRAGLSRCKPKRGQPVAIHSQTLIDGGNRAT